MIRVTIIVSLALMLSGCESIFGIAENECGGRGHKNIKIEYGDGKFLVDAVVRVKKKRELRFKLDPDRRSDLGYDYKKTVVETDGKTVPDDWVNGSDAYNNNRYFKVCVDNALDERGYNYTVTFTDPDTSKQIGLVDPRVIVEN